MHPRIGWVFSFFALTAAMACAAGKIDPASVSTVSPDIPFEFQHRSVIVHAMIGERGPFDMLLDTGVDPSVVDLSLARAVGLKLANSGEAGSGGGTEKNPAYETSLPSLQLGPIVVHNLAAVAMDLSKTSAALGRPIQGVLGYSLQRDRILQIDYPHRLARFLAAPPSDVLSDERTCMLSFKYDGEILLEGVAVNGKPVVANLDTGSDAFFQLTPHAVVELGLQAEAAQGRASQSVGFNGSAAHREGTVREIRVGSWIVRSPAVVFYGAGTGHDDEAWALRIGNGFLQDCVVTIDYPRTKVFLRR